jgi:hypothetical protein
MRVYFFGMNLSAFARGVAITLFAAIPALADDVNLPGHARVSISPR